MDEDARATRAVDVLACLVRAARGQDAECASTVSSQGAASRPPTVCESDAEAEEEGIRHEETPVSQLLPGSEPNSQASSHTDLVEPADPLDAPFHASQLPFGATASLTPPELAEAGVAAAAAAAAPAGSQSSRKRPLPSAAAHNKRVAAPASSLAERSGEFWPLQPSPWSRLALEAPEPDLASIMVAHGAEQGPCAGLAYELLPQRGEGTPGHLPAAQRGLKSIQRQLQLSHVSKLALLLSLPGFSLRTALELLSLYSGCMNEHQSHSTIACMDTLNDLQRLGLHCEILNRESEHKQPRLDSSGGDSSIDQGGAGEAATGVVKKMVQVEPAPAQRRTTERFVVHAAGADPERACAAVARELGLLHRPEMCSPCQVARAQFSGGKLALLRLAGIKKGAAGRAFGVRDALIVLGNQCEDAAGWFTIVKAHFDSNAPEFMRAVAGRNASRAPRDIVQVFETTLRGLEDTMGTETSEASNVFTELLQMSDEASEPKSLIE